MRITETIAGLGDYPDTKWGMVFIVTVALLLIGFFTMLFTESLAWGIGVTLFLAVLIVSIVWYSVKREEEISIGIEQTALHYDG